MQAYEDGGQFRKRGCHAQHDYCELTAGHLVCERSVCWSAQSCIPSWPQGYEGPGMDVRNLLSSFMQNMKVRGGSARHCGRYDASMRRQVRVECEHGELCRNQSGG